MDPTKHHAWAWACHSTSSNPVALVNVLFPSFQTSYCW
jgi:hypothetical protein